MKKNLILISALVLSVGILSARHDRKKKAKAPEKPKQEVQRTTQYNPAATFRLCDATGTQPAWFLSTPKGFSFPTNFPQPAAYRLVSTIDSAWMNFLHKVSYTDSNTRVTVPVFINETIQCKEFLIQRVETMDSALQAKYPMLMTFKARTAENGLNTARLECDENGVKVMVRFDNKTYFMQPMPYGDKTIYCCYAQDDVNFHKKAFEK